MKIIKTTWFPPGKFRGIMLFGVLVIKGKSYKPTTTLLNHELIHCYQAKDCGGWLCFYFLYIGYWLYNLIKHPRTSYRSIPFEREAYENERNYPYLDHREKKAWKKYKD